MLRGFGVVSVNLLVGGKDREKNERRLLFFQIFFKE
jgi:hypothetical protein